MEVEPNSSKKKRIIQRRGRLLNPNVYDDGTTAGVTTSNEENANFADRQKHKSKEIESSANNLSSTAAISYSGANNVDILSINESNQS